MQLIRNSGNERVVDELRKCLVGQAGQNETTSFSLAHKRWSQGEAGKLEGELAAITQRLVLKDRP